MFESPDVVDHQQDPVRRRRLRWRARRGLLENDLVLARFFEQHESSLSDQQVAALDGLLDCSDNDLLDLILGRQELPAAAATPAMNKVLQLLRSA
jgi:antitoxin CptB